MVKKSKKEIVTRISIIGLFCIAILTSFAYELGDFEDEYRPPNQFESKKFYAVGILSLFIPVSQIIFAMFISITFFDEKDFYFYLYLGVISAVICLFFTVTDII